jgi:hypothetical protein
VTSTTSVRQSRTDVTSPALSNSSSYRRENAAGGKPLRLVPRGSGRRPVIAVASLAVVVVCAALFAVIYVHSSRLVAVIGVARQVPEGQVLEVADLRQVDVSVTSGVDVVPVTDASQVIGRQVSVTLLPGTLLSPSDLGRARVLPANEAIVGVDLKPGMMPASGVTAGETVLVVLTTPAGSALSVGSPGSAGSKSPQSQPTVIATATVVGVDSSPDDGGSGDVVVSLDVPLVKAPLIADTSAAGQAALVLVGGP